MKTEEKASLPEPARGHDVFVSYSRADRERVLALTQGLAERGKRAWVDLEDIPPSAEWMAEIRVAIEAADGYLVVVSPALAGSTVCAEELEHAREAGKRIVPVQVRATDPDSVPQTLAALNWIDATGPDLDPALDRIVTALETDLEHTKAHTRLLVRASEWDQRDHDRSLLLRGQDLKQAEAFLVAATGKEPAPTPIQARFIQASRQGASRRQRAAIAVVTVLFLLAAVLGVVAWQQRGEAIDQRATAQEQAAISRSRELASAATSQLTIDPELSLLLAIEGAGAASTPEAETALREALIASNHLATFSGQQDPIVDASISEDGTRLMTTTFWVPRYVPQGDQGDHSTRIWDVASGEQLASIDMSDSTDPRSEFSADGERVLSSGGMTPFISDASTGETVATLNELGDAIAHFDPTGRVVAGSCAHGPVCLVGADTGHRLHTLRAPGEQVVSIAFTPDGRSVVALAERAWLIWDARTASLVGRFDLPWRARWLSMSGDGSRVLISNLKHTGVWTISGGRAVRLLDVRPRLSAYPRALEPAIDASGSRVASADAQGTVTVWSVESGDPLSVLDATPTVDVEFAPSGHTVLTTSEDHTAIVWDADTGDAIKSFLGTPGHLFMGRFSPDGSMVVTSGSDLTARLWTVDPGRPLATLTSRPGGDGQAAAFSAGGDEIYTGGYAGNVHTWNLANREVKQTFRVFPSSHERYRDWIWSIAVSPDGSTMAVSGTRRMVLVLDAATGQRLSALQFAPGEGPGTPGAGKELAGVTWSVAFSPDGSLLASGSQDGVARLWDPDTGELIRRLSGHEAAVDFVAFSPDGTKLLTGSDDGTGRIWRVEDGRTLLTLKGQPQGVTSVAWSADAELLATTSYDGTVFIRDAATGLPLQRLNGSSGVILASAFSPDSRWLATTSDEDGALRIWNARTGRLADEHEGTLRSTGYTVGWSHDGALVALPGYTGPFGSGTGETLVFRCELCVDPGELIQLAKERVTRPLTDAERLRFLHE